MSANPAGGFILNVSTSTPNHSVTNCSAIISRDTLAIYASVSICSILSNILVIVVICYMIKQKQIPLKNVFLVLAFSDLCVGFMYALHAIIEWNLARCSRSKTLNMAIFGAHSISVYSNQGLTLYVTLMRAFATSTSKVLTYQQKNWRRILVELAIFVNFGCIPLYVEWAAIAAEPGSPDYEAFPVTSLVYFVALVVTMAVMAFYIIIKLHYYRSSVARSSTTTKDDFQIMVVVVALVFCACHALSIARFSLYLQNNPDHVRVIPWIDYATLVNSSVNPLIYFTVSRSFRRSLVGLGKLLVSKLRQEYATEVS